MVRSGDCRRARRSLVRTDDLTRRLTRRPTEWCPSGRASTRRRRASSPRRSSTIPGWLAVGPDRTGHRRFVARRYHRGRAPGDGPTRRAGLRRLPRRAPRRGGRHVRGRALPAAGAHLLLVRARASCSPGPGPSCAGCGPRRSRTAGIPRSGTCSCGSSRWIPCASAPASGGRCWDEVFEGAGAPVYLDTSNPANLPYYSSFGFEQIGRGELPRGAKMWFMRRP